MTWEYATLLWKARRGKKLHAEDFTENLNKYGADGWELVSASETSMEGGATRDVLVVFKRPVPAE